MGVVELKQKYEPLSNGIRALWTDSDVDGWHLLSVDARTVLRMRWDNLFDDLEGQLEQGLSAEDVDLRAEEERLRLGHLTMRSRILAIHDSFEKRADYSLRLQLRSGEHVSVRPATIGKDWFSGDIRDETRRDRQCIVPLDAIAALTLTKDQVERSLTDVASETGQSLAGRLSLPFVLRDLCRRRVGVDVQTITTPATGTIDRVGRDHFDLAVHEPGTARRENDVSTYRVVPFGELVILRL